MSEYCRQLVASGILQWPSARQKAPSHAFSESLFHLETHVEDLPEAVTAYYRYLGMGRGVSYIPYHMGVMVWSALRLYSVRASLGHSMSIIIHVAEDQQDASSIFIFFHLFLLSSYSCSCYYHPDEKMPTL